MEEERKIFFLLSAKVLFLSWFLQIVFALWVAALFFVFAKADYGAEELDFVSVDRGDEPPPAQLVFPASLVAPNPKTEGI